MKGQKISGILLYLLGFALLLLLYVNFVFFPVNQKRTALNSEHEEDVVQAMALDRQAVCIDELRQNVEKLKSQLENAGCGTDITGKNIAEDIGKMLDSAGAKLESVNVGGETPVKGKTASDESVLKSVAVEVKILCTGDQLTAFIGSIEKQSKGIYQIHTVSVTPEAGKFSADLNLELYYFSKGKS